MVPAGKPVAYKMMTNAAPLMLATPSSLLQARGGFALKNIWVTPHSEDERWPAGSYTIQSRGGEGLPKWAEQNRAVDSGNDPVVWHSFGGPPICATRSHVSGLTSLSVFCCTTYGWSA